MEEKVNLILIEIRNDIVRARRSHYNYEKWLANEKWYNLEKEQLNELELVLKYKKEFIFLSDLELKYMGYASVDSELGVFQRREGYWNSSPIIKTYFNV